MRGLTILVVEANRARFRTALTLAISSAALGARTRLFCDADAVALLAPTADPDHPRLAAAGLPDLRALIAIAVDHDVALIACQTGLSVAGLAIDALVEGVEPGGMVTLLATLDHDRLVMA